MIQGIIFNEINQMPQIGEIDVDKNEGELIELRTSAMNHRDVWITKGKYPGLKPGVFMGADGCGMHAGKRVVINPGMDWGKNESCQGKSFRVLGVPDHGTFAEAVYIDSSQVYDCPSHLSDVEAAALPVAGVTAYRALILKCQPKFGDRVLITGIGGGVALMAMQFAMSLGCKVYVTSGSDQKIQRAKDMGAMDGYNYKNDAWPQIIKDQKIQFDIIIDSAGGHGFNHLIGLCAPGGKICFYGSGQGAITDINAHQVFWKQLSIHGSTMGSDDDFKAMLNFVSLHKIKPIIHEVLPIRDFEKGFQMMEKGQQFGKIVFENIF